MHRKTKLKKHAPLYANDYDLPLKPKSKKKYAKRKSSSSMIWLDQSYMDEDQMNNVFDFFKIGEA